MRAADVQSTQTVSALTMTPFLKLLPHLVCLAQAWPARAGPGCTAASFRPWLPPQMPWQVRAAGGMSDQRPEKLILTWEKCTAAAACGPC